MTSEDNRQTDESTERSPLPDAADHNDMNAAMLLTQLDLCGAAATQIMTSGWFGWSVDTDDVLTVWYRRMLDDGSATSEPVVRTWRLVELGGDVAIPEPWASVAPGDPHPVSPCLVRFDADGLTGTDEDGWICSRDRHTDPLHVATTGPGGYVVALYNTATHEYRRTVR